MPALYDGFAAWYDQNLAEFTLAAGELIERLLGPGPGRCLDLCCGTGLHLPRLVKLGWTVTGVDISVDQLDRARQRANGEVELVLADAKALPFHDEAFDAVVSMFSHTDVDDFRSLVLEGARLLAPGGLFVYVGLHPCFIGPHSSFLGAQGLPALHAGYSRVGRYTEGPGISPEGLRARVGAVHLQLEDLVQAFLDAPLRLSRFEEHGDGEYPSRVAVLARR